MSGQKLPMLSLDQRRKLAAAKRYCMEQSIRYSEPTGTSGIGGRTVILLFKFNLENMDEIRS